MLKLSNITKDYKVASDYVHALKGVSLEFRENEFVSVLGQSGCGKTTLLNIIGGLDHYTSGDLVIQGKSTKNFTDRDWDVYRNHRIGFIFQSYNLIPHQSVLGNVELSLTIAGVSREERRKRSVEALERVGLGAELHKKPNQLSGGQMQRVAIARALVNNPDILLADEPTGALDSETSVQIMELIKEIASERLVIMVTHNPELAEQYSTRIVRLKDGLVESDSNPYHKEEAPAAEAAQEHEKEESKKKREKKLRAKMSFFTSLALSARNLLTKKGRTIITSVAGSIGIISVCLVLALSSGFNAYIKKSEEDMLSYYPIEVSETAFNITSAMTSFTSAKDMPTREEMADKVYVDSFLINLANNISVKNDISDDYLDYIGKMDDKWYSEIQYGYGTKIANNLFTKVLTGIPASQENAGRPNEEKYYSLTQLKAQYISDLNSYAENYSYLVPYSSLFANVVNKMPGTSDFAADNYGKYVLSQYDVIKGTFPKANSDYYEAVLVVGNNNEVSDLTLAQLGILDEPDFLKLFKLGQDESVDRPADSEASTILFSNIIGKEYVFYNNDMVYTKNEPYNPLGGYAFEYTGTNTSLEVTTDSNGRKNGLPIRITGILRLKDGLTYGCLQSGLNLTEKTELDYISMNESSEIVEWMKGEDGEVEFEGKKLCLSPAENLNDYYQTIPYTVKIPNGMGGFIERTVTLHINVNHDGALQAVGGVKKIVTLSIYATDFDGKEALLKYLDEWNHWCEDGGSYNGHQLSEPNKITYTDRVGLLMGMMQTMLNVITVVLVAFTAISLVVSSVMIGIITYVSVVERVKEIGVLRSLGARKHDIRSLFNAETFIIGLTAGLIGIAATYLLSIGINAIILAVTGIGGICALPPLTAVIMVIVSVTLTLISGLIPAQAAAKKDPVIALRTE